MAGLPNTLPSSTSEEQFKRRLDQTKKNVLLDNGFINHYVITLSGIAYDQATLGQSHIARLTEFLTQMNNEPKCVKLVITSISGYASSPGSDKYNDELSRNRALNTKAVIDSLFFAANGTKKTRYKNSQTAATLDSFRLLNSHIVQHFGESQATAPSDTAIDRKVEIAYFLQMDTTPPVLPNDPPKSEYWKLDFSASVETGAGILGGKITAGTLSMMDNGFDDVKVHNGVSQVMNIKYISVGLAVGKIVGKISDKLTDKLKPMSRLKKWSDTFTNRLKQLWPFDVPTPPSAREAAILEVLSNTGISGSLVSYGREFKTEEPLSFAQMLPFKVIEAGAGSAVFLASGSGSMLMLTNDNFLSATIMAGGDTGVTGIGVDLSIQAGEVFH